MSFSSSNAIPPGWYPDPGGSREWRVWTGEEWSEVTRSYGDPARSSRFAGSFRLVQALRLVFTLGVVGVLGGLGLLVSVLAPGPAPPIPLRGGLPCPRAVWPWRSCSSARWSVPSGSKSSRATWSPVAFLPGANLFVASALVTHRLGRHQVWRIASEVMLLAIFTVASRNDLWLCLGPVIVAYVESTWFGALIERLNGPSAAPDDAS